MSVREPCPVQPWRIFIGLRNVATPQHDDLPSDRVGRTLTEDIPRLREYLAEVMLPGLRDPAEGDNV